MPLVVDEAWGAHLYFHDELPAGALRGGADMVLSSTHKIVGSLTQSAILHLGRAELVDAGAARPLGDADRVDQPQRAADRLARRRPALRRHARGRSCSPRPWRPSPRPASASAQIPGLDVLDERLAGRDSVAAWDPLRLSIDVRGTGATGHRIAELMRERDDIMLELFSENVVVAVFGMGERAGPGAERLVEGLRHAVEAIGPARRRGPAARSPSRRRGGRSSSPRATPSSAPRRSSPSTRPRAGSPPSPSPPTRPESRTCSPASG